MAPVSSSSSEQPQTVATLRSEEQVDGVFACTRKERQISRAGSPYLTLELRDATGSSAAPSVMPTCWRGASSVASWSA
jgi:3'-5' exoribonuclease